LSVRTKLVVLEAQRLQPTGGLWQLDHGQVQVGVGEPEAI
jgi:hypothetical protein